MSSQPQRVKTPSRLSSVTVTKANICHGIGVHLCICVCEGIIDVEEYIGIVQKELAVDKTHAFGVRDPGSNPL